MKTKRDNLFILHEQYGKHKYDGPELLNRNGGPSMRACTCGHVAWVCEWGGLGSLDAGWLQVAEARADRYTYSDGVKGDEIFTKQMKLAVKEHFRLMQLKEKLKI